MNLELFGELLTGLLANAELAQALGWIFAVAMIVGGVLNEGGRQLASWIIAVLVYVVFQEMARAVMLESMGVHYQVSLVFVVLTSLVYLSGMVAGWSIVRLAKFKVRKEIRDGKRSVG